MGDKINLTGERFGKLVVMHRERSRVAGRPGIIFWRCRCDCGAEVVARWNMDRSLSGRPGPRKAKATKCGKGGAKRVESPRPGG